jgi:hypothetical protein
LLALDVVLPAAHPLAGRDVVEAYRWLGEAFRDALVALAPRYAEEIVLVDVAMARGDREAVRTAVVGSQRAREAAVCFGTLSPYEVGFRRRMGISKLVGLSQIRRRGVVAFQAGVYLPRREGAMIAPVGALLAGHDERVEAAADCSRLLASGRDADLGDIGLGEAEVSWLMAAVNEAAMRVSGSGPGGVEER